jgi:protein-S-isoprenylcysteine O-methyltransferase Ste14
MMGAHMIKAEWESIAAVYLPLAAAVIARVVQGKRRRQFAACLLSILWVAPTLLALQTFNNQAHWWSFSGDGVRFRDMPVACFAGWIVLWGLVPQLAFPRLHLGWVVAIMTAADLALMPICRPLIQLGPHWLIGEGLTVVVVLLPALCIARWTQDGVRLRARSAIQIATAGLVFLYFLPEIVFAARPGVGWQPLLHGVSWQIQLEIQVLLLLALPGISAVIEFAERGGGTPIPYDPPQRLVTSGIYRYCANPMQMSCAAVMLLWAGMLHNGWLVLAAAMATIYDAGIAEWDEKEDLGHRFADEWRTYRRLVHNWRLRWRPYPAGAPARIYIAATCGPCNEVRAWLEARHPLGLTVVDAEELPPGSIKRMRYEPGDGSPAVDGMRAMGRALEHLNFGWAMAGAALRLPGVWWGVQLIMDASGLGPRTLVAGAWQD